MSAVWHTTMSLDGFIAGPGDAMDWVFEYFAGSPMQQETIATTGAMLVGRRSYEVGRRDKAASKPSGEAFGEEGLWSGPQFVFTHRPPGDEDDPSDTFVSGDVAPVVAQARAAADGKDVLVIGADVARQCLAAGLLDEIRIHLAPVLLGDGIRLYGGPGLPRVELAPVSSQPVGRQTDLRFRVLR
jgi:dihydrofolate reductase